MKNKTLSIISMVIVFSAALFLFEPKSHADLKVDSDYLVARAITLANFSPDDSPTIPQISYLMPGEKPVLENKLDHSTKVVNVFDPRFGIGGVQAVFKAPTYILEDGGQALTFSSFKKTVGDILTENGIVLAKEDQIVPPLGEVPAQHSIKITRVSVAQIDEFETLPYQTKTIDDPTLERGKQVVSQTGQEGKKRLTYQVRRENGIEVSRTLIDQAVEVKTQDKIIKNGTKVVVLSSVRGIATATNLSNAVVSVRYKKGTLLRITNLSNGVSILKTVNYTWGTASAPSGIVLDLSWNILDELKFNGSGAGPNVLVEEIKQ